MYHHQHEYVGTYNVLVLISMPNERDENGWTHILVLIGKLLFIFNRRVEVL